MLFTGLGLTHHLCHGLLLCGSFLLGKRVGGGLLAGWLSPGLFGGTTKHAAKTAQARYRTKTTETAKATTAGADGGCCAGRGFVFGDNSAHINRLGVNLLTAQFSIAHFDAFNRLGMCIRADASQQSGGQLSSFDDVGICDEQTKRWGAKAACQLGQATHQSIEKRHK